FRRQGIIAQLRNIQARDGEIGGDTQIELAQGRFADVQFNLRFDGRLGFTEVIEEQLGNGKLGKDILGLNVERVIATGKTVGEGLATLGGGQLRQFLALRK